MWTITTRQNAQETLRRGQIGQHSLQSHDVQIVWPFRSSLYRSQQAGLIAKVMAG